MLLVFISLTSSILLAQVDYKPAGNTSLKLNTKKQQSSKEYTNYKQAIPFSSKSITGKDIIFNLESDKMTLLYFWFTTCVRCKQAKNYLNQLQNQYSDRLNIIGINMLDESYEKVKTYIEKNNIMYPIIANGKDLARDYQAFFAPTILLINQKGDVLYDKSGFSEQDLKKCLDNHL